MRKNGITLSEVRRYLELTGVISESADELRKLDEKFLFVVPTDGYRLVGSYKICHKTQRKKSTAWKQVCLEKLGQAIVDKILKSAQLGKPSHSIAIERRQTAEEMREIHKIPKHIPDEQIDDFVYKKDKNGLKERGSNAKNKD